MNILATYVQPNKASKKMYASCNARQARQTKHIVRETYSVSVIELDTHKYKKKTLMALTLRSAEHPRR